MRAFKPTGPTVNIDVSSSNQEVALSTSPGGFDVRVMNNGTATAWINFGVTGTLAAVATTIPVGPGVTEVLRVGPKTGAVFAQAIAAGPTGKIYFTPGEGI